MNWIYDLVTNPLLITSVGSWGVAQVLKVIIHAIIYKKISFERLIGDGGMPSGHSATVSSLAIMCALICGFGSVEFAISAILAIIVCHDATGVRRETGKQAAMLNQLMRTLNGLTDNKSPEVKLKEFVGHTPMQVVVGVLIGIINALIMYAIMY